MEDIAVGKTAASLQVDAMTARTVVTGVQLRRVRRRLKEWKWFEPTNRAQRITVWGARNAPGSKYYPVQMEAVKIMKRRLVLIAICWLLLAAPSWAQVYVTPQPPTVYPAPAYGYQYAAPYGYSPAYGPGVGIGIGVAPNVGIGIGVGPGYYAPRYYGRGYYRGRPYYGGWRR
jgi:hypothetical protein